MTKRKEELPVSAEAYEMDYSWNAELDAKLDTELFFGLDIGLFDDNKDMLTIIEPEISQSLNASKKIRNKNGSAKIIGPLVAHSFFVHVSNEGSLIEKISLNNRGPINEPIDNHLIQKMLNQNSEDMMKNKENLRVLKDIARVRGISF